MSADATVPSTTRRDCKGQGMRWKAHFSKLLAKTLSQFTGCCGWLGSPRKGWSAGKQCATVTWMRAQKPWACTAAAA